MDELILITNIPTLTLTSNLENANVSYTIPKSKRRHKQSYRLR